MGLVLMNKIYAWCPNYLSFILTLQNKKCIAEYIREPINRRENYAFFEQWWAKHIRGTSQNRLL